MCGSAHAQNSPDTAAAVLASEFPPYDYRLLSAVQRGIRNESVSRGLAAEPDSVETLSALIAENRIAEAIGVATRIFERHPDRAVPAIRTIAFQSFKFSNAARGESDALQQIAAQARTLAAKLPREEAARLARQLVMIERRPPGAPGVDTYRAALDEFLRDYAGTEEALLTQVDLLERGRVSWAQIDALDAFARAHPRSVAGAKALHIKGWQLSVNVPATGLERRGADPTERFFRVLTVVKELESGDYPKCEWVDRAPQIITGFFASNPRFAPGNADRMAAEYIAFARTHLTFGSPDPASDGAGYLVTSKLAELYKAEGDPDGAVERALDALVKDTGRLEFAYLKASFYLRTAVDDTTQRTFMRGKAKAALKTLSEEGSAVYQRKALATLACLEFEDRDYRAALEHFGQYLQRYSQSPYAWVAALRTGATHEALGDWRAAATAYQAAATGYGSIPLAQLLGHEYAARSLEGIDKLEDALHEQESALRAWDANYGDEYTLKSRDVFASTPAVLEPVRMITMDTLSERIRQLRSWLAHPSGRLVARGQWLLEHEQRADAIDTVRRMLRQFPGSPLTRQARTLLHHAQLELALTQADVESTANPEEALRRLSELAREPYDDTICVAGIARATLLTASKPDQADSTMRETLTQCRANSVTSRSGTPSALEADVLAIRDAVFLPSGGGVYGTAGWNAFTWPSIKPAFLLVNPAITIETSDGVATQMVLRAPLTGVDNVVFFTDDQIHLLNGVISALGGTKKFVPASVMATPNQPAGPAVDIKAFWNRFFPCRPGHWGGWEFEAYPQIGSIQFLDAARTKAAVPVTIGYSGGTVVLEKQNGVWRALRLTDPWIT
jgi:tetratricopeptide (TPR) repeat protein